jgi:Uncharacterized protein conserved in bacteria
LKAIYEKYSKEEAKALNPLVLAYMGDSVYESFIRLYLIKKQEGYSAHKLHLNAVNYVKAEGQSQFILSYIDKLNQEETDIFKRGRNTKTNTSPKNGSIIDYRNATGFEALIGYLYLIGNEERINIILESVILFYHREEENNEG